MSPLHCVLNWEVFFHWLVINTNLLHILHRFQVTADYLSNFRQRQGVASLYTPSLEVIPCEYRYKSSMQKTSQFKTQCKGDISHAFETAKITVFYPTLCKTPVAPLQNELLCWTFVHLSLLLTFILCKFLYHYVWLIIVDYTAVGLIMLVSHSKWGKGNDL